MKNRLVLLFLLLAILTTSAVAGEKATPGIPTTLNYQGRLTWLNGQPLANNNYNITLRLWDAESGGNLLWEESQLVYVYDSVFSTVMGALTPLTPAVDFGQHLWLGIEVPDIVAGEMGPRIPLTATPYSLIAADVDDGVAVTSLNGLTEDVNLVPGNGMAITPSGNSLVLTATGGGGGGSDADWGINGNDMYSLPTGNVGIGTITPEFDLHLVGSGVNGVRFKIEDVTNPAEQNFQLANLWLETSLAKGNINVTTTTGGNKTMYIKTQTPGTDLVIEAEDEIRVDFLNRMRILRDGGDVAEFSSSDEFLLFGDSSGESVGVTMRGYDFGGANDGGEILLNNNAGYQTVRLDGFDNPNLGSTVELYGETGNLSLALNGQRDAANRGGLARLFDQGGTETIRMEAQNNGAAGQNGGRLQMFNAAGVQTVALSAQEDGGTTQRGVLKLTNDAGDVTIELDADYGTSNEGRVITSVLEITGGSDLSEQFDISGLESILAPGHVVSIDPDRPGELKLSDRAYDSCVAGVISGAGGVRPGMVMGQRGSEADGEYPVALTGRVYVQVDASTGPVRPGDLLTTSEVPGHAMKVTDTQKAHGAVLGKAMTRLDSGRGLVLVLVTLQ